MDNYELPKEGFLRLSQILELIPIGRSTFWRKVHVGEYPRPIKLGTRTAIWRASDIQEIINSIEDNRKPVFSKGGDDE